MRILVINWRDINHPEAGGAEVHFQETFTRIVAAGHHVTLLCSRVSGAAEHEWIDGIEVIRNGGNFTFNLTVPGFYRSRLADADFDLIIEYHNKIPFFLPALVKDRPILVLVQHLFGAPVFRETNPVFASYVYLAERIIPYVYGSCAFEVISESTMAELKGMGIPSGQMEVVHCGIGRDLFSQVDALGEKSGMSVIYLGRLKRYKNVDRLIRAMKSVHVELPDARLSIVGDGDHSKALKMLSAKLGLENIITFTGSVSDAEKIRLLRHADVAAFPSDKEGWGLSVIEANACHTPVVATDVPGLRDAVVNQETGILTPLGDTAALADALIRLLKDDTLRIQMAQKAADRATGFTWDLTAGRTLNIIERVVKSYKK